MSGKWHTKEFKLEAVKQITDRDYLVGDVSERLGVTIRSLYEWIKRYGNVSERYQSENN